MASRNHNNNRNQRFASDGNDIVTSNVQCSLSILQAVEMPDATHQDLIKGLEKEIKSNINLQVDWNRAIKWFQPKKNVGDWAKYEEYHLALHTFSLNTFYAEFNEGCRNLRSKEEAKSFKFRCYFNLLLRALRNIKGNPQMISSSMELYRGCSIKFPSLAVNDKFLFKQFTSTSLIKSNAENFLSSNGTLFVIEGIQHGNIGSQSAIGLKDHSAFSFENEVLTNPFQVFKITKIEEEGSWWNIFSNSVTIMHLKATY